VLVSLKDDNWERGLDAETISSIRTHIALYRAFPQIGGIARPHARNATIFAQLGMDIPVLGLFHKSHLFCDFFPYKSQNRQRLQAMPS
jgi:class II aldolase/adducin family protein